MAHSTHIIFELPVLLEPRVLLVLHVLQETSLSQLRRGMKHLGNELSERTGQLKQLIKNNFERCIRCSFRVHTCLTLSIFM